MTKHEIEVQALLLRHQANGCISALVRWEEISNTQGAAIVIPALKAQVVALEARADGLDTLVEQWDEFGPYFKDSRHD